MNATLKRIILFLLVLVMGVGILPAAYAAETTEATEQVEDVDFPRTAEGNIDYNKLTEEQCVALMEQLYGVSLLAVADTTGAVSTNGMVYRANEKSDYTLTYKGISKSVNAIYTHSMTDANGVSRVAYCLNPVVDVPDNGSSYEGITGTGADGWADSVGLSKEQQRAVGLVLLYGAPNKLQYDGDRMLKRCQEAATQIIIWEILCGMRSVNPPYNCTNSGLIDSFRGTCQVTDMAWILGHDDTSTNYVINAYNSISADLAAHDIIPSFASRLANQANTKPITLNPVGNGTYSVTVTDTNNVLSKCTFTNGNGMTYSVSGNQLTITASSAAAIPSGAVAQIKEVPNLETKSFLVWQRPGAQEMCTVTDEAKDDPTPFYMKLRIATGTISGTKTIEGGGSLQGWEFQLKSGNTVIATATSDSNGRFSFADVAPGAYTVVENISADSQYECTNNNQTVTVTGGSTATVSFHNKLKVGSITLKKETNTGNNLGGWEVDLYTSAKQFIKTYRIPDSGTLVIADLIPGTYYLYEKASDDPLWVCDTEEKGAIVPANGNVTVTFRNTHLGIAKVKKDTNTRVDLEGWQFGVYSDEACTVQVATLTSDANGEDWTYLEEGVYWIKEIWDENGRWNNEYWECDTEVQRIEVKAGEEASVTFTNTHYGKTLIRKSMATDGPVEGWQFKVTRLADNADMGTLISGADGTILSGNLLPGEYRIEEIIPDDSPYYCKSENPVTVTIAPGATAEVAFENALRPGKLVVQKENGAGEPIAGSKYLLEWSEDGSTWNAVVFSDKGDVVEGGCATVGLEDGCLVTDGNGAIEFTGLHPLLQYRLSEIEAPNGYSLLPGFAFVGMLEESEDYCKTVKVVNSRGYSLPATYSFGYVMIPFVGFLLLAMAFVPGVKAIRVAHGEENPTSRRKDLK